MTKRATQHSLLIAAALAAPALAGSATWTGGGADNNWITPANWSAAVGPSDAAAIYTFSGTTRLSPNVDQNWLTGRLQFSATGFTVTNTPGATLSLAGTLNASILNNSAAGLNSVVSAPITVVSATGGVVSTGRTLDTGTGSVALNGGIDIGTFNFIKIGAGILDLPTANTMASTAVFAANNGTVRVGNNAALGSATFLHGSGLTVPASTAVTSSGGNAVRLIAANPTLTPITLPNNVTLNTAAGALVLTDSAVATQQTTASMTLAGTVSLTGTKSVGVETNGLAAITGNIVDGTAAGLLNKGNPGTLILSGNNSYSGGFNLGVGTLRAASDTAFGTGTFAADGGTASNPTTFLLADGGSRTFANNVRLGSTNTLQVGNATFANNVTFTGTTQLTGLNADATPNTADDNKPVTVAGGMTFTLGGAIGEAAAGYGIAKSGPGTLALGASNTYTGTTVVSNGTLQLNAGASFGTGVVTNNANVTLVPSAAGSITVSNAIGGTGSLTHTGSGTATLTGANTYTGTTTVNHPAATLKVTYAAAGTSAATPLLSGGGADIQRGAVVFDYTASTTPAAVVRSLLAQSFVDTTTPGVMDSGPLRSSTATAKRGLGYKDDGAGNVTVKATLFGDADLDGGVSINDFNALAGSFGQSSGKVWTDGDFDYDGGVSINDFNLLAGNFGQTVPASSDAWVGLLAFAAAHDDLDAFSAITGVPEPTVLTLLGIGAAGLLRRRSRRPAGETGVKA